MESAEKKQVKTVALVSNYFNHHQKPFCDAMYNLLGEGNFYFIETTPMPEERKKLGYGMDGYPSYVIPYMVVHKSLYEIRESICRADVVIIGSAPDFFVEQRVAQNKLVFRYSERPLKNGIELLKYIPRFIKWHKRFPMSKKLYMLCASSYTASDYAKFGLFKNRCYKWAYFTEVIKYEDVDKLIREKKKNSILWVARFLELKHPELCIEVAKRLRDEGYEFELNMIGIGEKQEETKSLVHSYGLDEYVNFLGAMPAANVRKYMDEAEIFLFTSDKKEGWGAVVNEAMNSACVTISSDAAGVTDFLVDNGENGYSFKSENINDLYSKVKFLLDNPDKRVEMAKKAYETMLNEWNAENAAKKLIELSTHLINGEKYPNPFEKGVCSKSK